MSDLIDRQALRKAMYHEAMETYSYDQKWDSGCWIRYKMFERVIDSMPSAQPEHRWIPVSERLPETAGYYLTTTIFKEVYCDFWNGYNFGREEMVIAWMPLPEPWKEDKFALWEDLRING